GKVASPGLSNGSASREKTVRSVTTDFAFASGARKSPSIPGRRPFLILRSGVSRFVSSPECETAAPQFALDDTSVGSGPGNKSRDNRASCLRFIWRAHDARLIGVREREVQQPLVPLSQAGIR